MEQTKLLEIVEPEGSQGDESCLTFVMNKEDHTIGNSLRYLVMKNPETQFCGYNIPHPSENKINFRIQTHGTSAKDIYRTALSDLNSVCEHILTRFKGTVENFKSSKDGNNSEEDDNISEGSSNECSDNDEPMEQV